MKNLPFLLCLGDSYNLQAQSLNWWLSLLMPHQPCSDSGMLIHNQS